jgi:hypothetical protein
MSFWRAEGVNPPRLHSARMRRSRQHYEDVYPIVLRAKTHSEGSRPPLAGQPFGERRVSTLREPAAVFVLSSLLKNANLTWRSVIRFVDLVRLSGEGSDGRSG